MWDALASRSTGFVVVRDRDGLRHGVWVQEGFVVGLHVAGRFDPLLDLLRRDGALSVHAYASCVRALFRSDSGRCGTLASEIAGVERQVVRAALRRQAEERMAALLQLAQSAGHDAWFEAREIPACEVSVRMPLGALLRRVQEGAAKPAPTPHSQMEDPAEARRKLRALAKRLHPDRHGHLDPIARRKLETELAQATAVYHGLAHKA